EEGEGGSRIVTSEGPHRQAREVVRLLLGEVAALGGRGHQLAQHRPEMLQVASLEDRVERLHAGDERLADLVRHAPAIASPRFPGLVGTRQTHEDRKSTRLNSSHVSISYAVFCLK